MKSTLEQLHRDSGRELADLATRGAELAAADDFDPESQAYRAHREAAEAAKARHTELGNMLDMRSFAQTRTPAASRPAADPGQDAFGRVLREYDRGNSERFAISYDIVRELQTGDPYFTPSPTRIQVAALPFLTPSLDLVRTVPVGSNAYDFVVPPPVESAQTVAEGAKKPTIDWVSTPVSGTLETDAVILDTTRQTLQDDATAERTLRAWLTDAVRKRQDTKVAAAITGATGTATATGATVAEGIRMGKAELSELGITATAAYVNPADGAALDLDLMAASGAISGVSTAWGMRIVESTAVAAGAPIVGAMNLAVYLLYRASISTYMTDSGTTDEVTPRDRFSHNLIGLLAEGRSRAHVVFPQALCRVTVTTTP